MAEQQKKKWLQEREEMEIRKSAKEEQRRMLIFKKRQEEKESLNLKLEIARNNFAVAQEILQRALDKKNAKSEQLLELSASTKVKINLKFIAQN